MTQNVLRSELENRKIKQIAKHSQKHSKQIDTSCHSCTSRNSFNQC